MKTITASITRLHPAAQLLLLAGAVFVAANPKARRRAANALSAVGETLVDVWPVVQKLMALSTQKQMDAAAARSLMDSQLAISRANKLPDAD